jgi:hypothetical protein
MTRELKSARAADRRSCRRYRIEQRLYYRLCSNDRVCETGKTLDISSSGVRFTTRSPLAPGQVVELAMHWPALLGGGCPLKLHMMGYVVREEGHTAAVRIMRYEFRTRRESAPEVAENAKGLSAAEDSPSSAPSFGRRTWLSGASS